MSVEAHGSVGKLLTALRGKNGGVVQLWHKPGGRPSANQIAQRAFFFEAKEAWNSLSSEDKLTYTERAKPMALTGYNLFIKEYAPVPELLSMTKSVASMLSTSGASMNWTNAGNAGASDDSYATASASEEDSTFYNTRDLIAKDFGFTIPSGATIMGIIVEIEKKCNVADGGNNVKDLVVKLNTSADSAGSESKADTGTSWPTTEAFISYGSDSDLWTDAWTADDINSSNFGARLGARLHTSGSSVTASVDSFRITVWYQT